MGWSDLDRELILAHLRAEELRCSGCGMYLDESTSNDWAHTVHDQLTCNGCRAMQLHQETAEQSGRKPRPGQLTVVTKQPVTSAKEG